MWIELSSIILTSISATLYFFLSYRVIMPFFYNLNSPLNNATKLLVAFSFIGFAVVLYFFGGSAIALYKNLFIKDLSKALIFFVTSNLIGFVFSVIVFRLSTIVVQITMKENEKAELAKNNFHVAGFHGIVHLFFALLLTEKMVEIMLSFYAKF